MYDYHSGMLVMKDGGWGGGEDRHCETEPDQPIVENTTERYTENDPLAAAPIIKFPMNL